MLIPILFRKYYHMSPDILVSVLLNVFPEKGLWDHTITVCNKNNLFIEKIYAFPKWLYQFIIPLQNTGIFLTFEPVLSFLLGNIYF